MKHIFNPLAFASLSLLLLPKTLAQTLLDPSPGENVTIGEPYTIRWSTPPPGPLAIEIFGNFDGHVREVSYLMPDTASCDGWLINTECRKLNVSIPSGATSYVWDLTTDRENPIFSYASVSLTMGVYIDNLERGQLPEEDAPWYASSEFRLVEPPREESSTTTATRTSTTTTAASSTTTEEVESTTLPPSTPTSTPPGESESETATQTSTMSISTDGSVTPPTETPTDGAVSRSPSAFRALRLGIALASGWLLFF